MNQRRMMTGLLCLLPALLAAQQPRELQTKGKYEYEDATQLWRSTLNPAGLSRDGSADRGVSYFELSRQSGTYHRVQEGNAANQLLFRSERYQKIGKYLYGYGSFTFDMGRQFGRSWSDVLRSYNSNPYFSGSSVAGKYDFQDFDLTASLATVPFGHFTYGARLDYKVGDLSRLKDPRSRTNLADYRLTPAVTYAWGRSVAGLSGHYRRRKEKIPNITTVQTDPNLMYYTYTGMENTVGAVGAYSSFEREFVRHEFGGELSYSYRDTKLHSLTTLTYAKAHEDVSGDIMYQPGKYFDTQLRLLSQNRLQAGHLLHTLDLSAGHEQGYADEYKQEKVTEKDPITGIESSYWHTLITYNKRYKVTLTDADLHYRLLWTGAQASEITAYAGLRGTFGSAENKYTLPLSTLKYSRATGLLEGGYAFFRRQSRALWVEASAGYSASLSSSLRLADATTDYAVHVLLPDMEYYGASYVQGHLQLQYQLPLTLKKHTNVWFVRATADYLHTDNGCHTSAFAVAFGLYH